MTKSRGIIDRSLTPDERFDNLVIPEPNSGCFLWIGASSPDGYGKFWFNGTMTRSTHHAWRREYGAVPHGMHVCHHCDNPACVNHRHLFVGTHSDNMRDQVAKGRNPRKNKTTCKHGHAYTEGTTGINSDGYRFCRVCSRIRDAKRADEQNAKRNMSRNRERQRAAANLWPLAARGGE